MMQHNIWKLVVGVILGASACESGTNDRVIVHPTLSNVPQDAIEIGEELPATALSAEALARWKAAREAILSAMVDVRIGVLGDPGPELFGEIIDVEVDASGRLFVLDGQTQEVRIFAPNGSHVGTFGGHGDGPNELRATYDIFVLEDGNLWAMTPSGHVKVFTEASGAKGEYQYHSTIQIPTAGRSCLLDATRLLVTGGILGDSEQPLFHEISLPEGASIGAFGRGYQTDDPLARYMLNINGSVACDPDRGALLHAASALPFLRMYGADGELIWTARVTDYRQQYLATEPTGFVQSAETSFDVAVGLHVLGDLALLQYRREPASEDDGATVIRSYLVDIESGAGALISDELPQVAAAFSGGFITVRQEPFPRVEIRRRSPTTPGQ